MKALEWPTKPGLFIKKALFKFAFVTFTLLLLTKCSFDHTDNPNLPGETDTLKQVLTDNQAGNKEQVFNYTTSGKDHDLFLVSAVVGKPLYAYLDGTLLPDDQFQAVCKVINYQRSIPFTPDPNRRRDSSEIRADKIRVLNSEVDSINNIIKQIEAESKANHSTDSKKELVDLSVKSAIRSEEIKDLSMRDYRHQVKYIPIDVKLHVLLTKIITGKKYTPEEREELNDLIKKKQGI